MADFTPALTHQIKWSVNDNRFDTDGSKPKSLALFITQDSILEFASYLQRLAKQTDKVRSGKVWDFVNKEEIELDGFYINGKGQDGQYGAFGSINLAQIPDVPEDSPF